MLQWLLDARVIEGVRLFLETALVLLQKVVYQLVVGWLHNVLRLVHVAVCGLSTVKIVAVL